MNEEDPERDRATQEEEGLFKADAVNEEDPERDRAEDPERDRTTQV